jgi:hypothetical protein
MRSTIDILDQAKGTNSDYWVAAQMGCKQSVVTTWRSRGHVGADSIVKLCEIAKVPVGRGLALCALETIKDKKLRQRIEETLSFKKPLNATKRSRRSIA